MFFNKTAESDNARYVAKGFRPLTGILFFNRQLEKVNLVRQREFPSPYGDFVFQRGGGRKACRRDEGKVSVPLRGFCFSTVVLMKLKLPLVMKCFRPLTGILFFNVGVAWEEVEPYKSFRPLTGILFFNAICRALNVTFTIGVSVPLRGFCFSTPCREGSYLPGVP